MENWNNSYYFDGDPMDFFGMYGHQQQEAVQCGSMTDYNQIPMLSPLPIPPAIQPTPLEYVERHLMSQNHPSPGVHHDNSNIPLYVPHVGGRENNMIDHYSGISYAPLPSVPCEPPQCEWFAPPVSAPYDHSISGSTRGGRSINCGRIRSNNRASGGRIFSSRGNHRVRSAEFAKPDSEDYSKRNDMENTRTSETQSYSYDSIRGFKGNGRKRIGGNTRSRGGIRGGSRGMTSSRNDTGPSGSFDNSNVREERHWERRRALGEASALVYPQSSERNSQRQHGNGPKENFRNPNENVRGGSENERNRPMNGRKPAVDGSGNLDSDPSQMDGEKYENENCLPHYDGGRTRTGGRRNLGENMRGTNDYGRNQREGRRNQTDNARSKSETWRGSGRDWRSGGDGFRHPDSGRPGFISNDRKNQADSWRFRKERDQEREDESKDRRKNFGTDSPRKVVEGTTYKVKETEASRREKLEENLRRGNYECMVCCESVRQRDTIWSCGNCFHVFHLRCIKQWARTSRDEGGGWRCPACQTVRESVPYDYYCFCGKMKDPEWNRRDTPHSCGEVCGKGHETPAHCTHTCILLCHPGPCPPCSVMASRNCECGKTSQVIICGRSQALLCGAECGKVLNCGAHNCSKLCHEGPCSDCEVMVKQVCYCGKNERSVQCIPSVAGIEFYECGMKCERTLDCNNHKCQALCHPLECSPCALVPKSVTKCPCGKVALAEIEGAVERQSCTDPVPTCGKVCGKVMSCGQPGKNHLCKELCHEGPCPPCTLTTAVKCRCGNMNKEIPCIELTTKADDARCNRKCTKKRSCWRHKCLQLCCIDLDHVCPLICNHNLSCGLHKCEEPCHRGNCPPCWRASFDELHCECGASVMFPPIPCGARPPECQQICSRPHPCTHVPNHTCHSQPECPPCTALTERYCHGKHELRKNVPCHQTEISCGRPCGKDLPCGRHKCIMLCHKGPCTAPPSTQQPGASAQWVCKQPCNTPRSLCGHPCGVVCHDGPCPDSPCREMVKVTCECGHRSTTRACSENATEYQQMAVALLASKMVDMQMGHSVDLRDLAGSASSRKESLKTLECNDECKLIERNRRLALCLQIRNPDLTGKIIPRYSDFMKQWGKKDPAFVQMVHDRLTELVQLAKQSKQKSRSYMFKVMGLPKRQLVHEYCEHFGCEAQSYDEEPNRNVVATALRDKSWLPSLSLLEVMKREAGSRKPPMQSTRPSSLASTLKPSLNSSTFSTLCSGGTSTASTRVEKEKVAASLSESSNTAGVPTASSTSQVAGNKDSSSAASKPPVIDYFDYTGD